jgi:hypothetical protein
MTKKVFIISAIALGVTLFFLGIYNFVFKKESAIENDQNMNGKSVQKIDLNGEKKYLAGTIVKVSEDDILQASLVRESEMIRYYAVDGTVWDIDDSGKNKKQISDKSLPGLQSVSWSPDGTRVITSFSQNGKNDFFVYDYQAKQGTKLKENLDTVKWDSIGAKIIYKYFDQKTSQRTLNVANPDGSDWKTLADIPFKNLTVSSIPQTSLVSFWNSPLSTEETVLQVVGVAGGNVEKIFSGRFGADYLWSRDGNSALISSLNEKNGKRITLGIIKRNGEYQDLNIPTMVSKCVWSADNKTVYYALPGEIPESSTLPEDYMTRKFYSVDTFWKVDVTTGKKERISELDNIKEKYDVSKPFLFEGETKLFFINRIDRKLYKVEL